MGSAQSNTDERPAPAQAFTYGYGELTADVLRSQAVKDVHIISEDIMSTLRRQCDLIMTSRAQSGHYACDFTVTEVVMGHPPIYDTVPYAERLAKYVRDIGCLVALEGNVLHISWSSQFAPRSSPASVGASQ